MELILIAILVFLSVFFETSSKQGSKCGTNTKPLTAPPKRPPSSLAQSTKLTVREKLKQMNNTDLAEWLLDNDDANELSICKLCLYCASGKYENGKWRHYQCCDETFDCKNGIIRYLDSEMNNANFSFKEKMV